MKTIELSPDQEEALRWVIKVCLKNYDMELGSRRCDNLISLFNQIQNAPDDTVMFMELVDTRNKCEDCGMITTDLITKGDHHGGTKTVCRDRNFCHNRSC